MVFIIWPVSQARAVVSLSTSATAGYYRDSRQDAHIPLFTQLSYTGLHAGGIESHLDLSLNNDFYENVWKAYPTQASIVFPISGGFREAPYRKSRVQLGRQLLAESFDLVLFDGAQAPIYWSSSGGIWPYAGTAHVLDSSEPVGFTLMGVSAFQDVLGFRFRGGYSSGGKNFDSQTAYGSLFAVGETLPLTPQFLIKGEWDVAETEFHQGLADLDLTLAEGLSVSARHSHRKPRRIHIEDNYFLFRALAFSPVEMQQAGAALDFSDSVRLELLYNHLRFRAGQTQELGDQQAATLTWQLSPRTSLIPTFHHTDGYGGELWDGGMRLRTALSDFSTLQSEVSAANFDRINRISGWAYQTRNGMEWELGPRLTTGAWVEFERNHLYDFDARIFGNVAFYQ